MNTYIVEGGIGKQVAFTAIIDALVKKDKEKIQVHSPYVDIFGGNTNVKYALDSNSIHLQDKRILDSQNIFIVNLTRQILLRVNTTSFKVSVNFLE